MIPVDVAIAIAVFLGLLFSLVLHEMAHAAAAWYFGDDTAYRLGRITLDPTAHIDPMMTIVVPAVTYLASNGQTAFGGAKPVPVDPSRLRNPRQAMIWIAAAGPAANLLIAAIVMLCVNLVPSLASYDVQLARNTLEIFSKLAVINIWLAIFNLIPVPPLDGSKILAGMLPEETAEQYLSFGSAYGMVLVAVLVLSDVTRALQPAVFQIVSAMSNNLIFVRFAA